jgi:predicted PurR-regulated permease PerM
MPESGLVPRWAALLGAWSWRMVGAASVLALVLWLVVQLRLVVVALFLGLVLTAVLRPLAGRYRRFSHPAVAAVLAVLTGAVALAAVLGLALLGISAQWPAVVERVGQGVQDVVALLRDGSLSISLTDTDVDRWTATAAGWLRANGGTLAGAAATRLGTLLVTLMVVALGVFSTVCFLISGDRMFAWFVSQLPRRLRAGWRPPVRWPGRRSAATCAALC